MKSNDFPLNLQQDCSNKKYFSSEPSSIKRSNPKQNYQESSHIKFPSNFASSHLMQANIYKLKVNSDACKLQAFVVPSAQVKYKNQELESSRQKCRKFIDFESLPLNIYAGREMKDILTKKSSQILLNLKKNMYKSHYSKINRNKQSLEKRSIITEEQRICQPKPSKEQLMEEKLIDKYRRLVEKKDRETGPKGIKQNYQMNTIATNQVPTRSKQMFVPLSQQINTVSNQKIESKVNRIFSKPVEMQQIRQILLCNSEKTVKMHEQDIIKNIILSRTRKGDMKRQFVDKQQINLPKTYSINNDKGYSDPLKFRQTKLKALKITNQRESIPKNVLSNNHIQVKQKVLTFAPPKNISSSAFIIYEVINVFPPKNNIQIHLPKRNQYPGKIHLSLNMKTSSEIASLTKIMTCIVVIQICVRYSINSFQQKYKIGLFQSYIKGTSAGIQPGQIYTIDQLLHGLMLPSGNDASLALARWGGNVLLINDHEVERKRIQELCSKSLPQTWALGNKFIKFKEQKLKAKRCYNRFIAEMNKKSRLLCMERTIYVNSHGLSNHLNKSCCIDLALLCSYAMRNEYFRKIVSCKQYNAIIDKQQLVTEKTIKRNAFDKRSSSTNEDPEQMNLCEDIEGEQFWNKSDLDEEQQDVELQKRMEYTKRQINWTNTHKLLHKKSEYIGIKTGVTVTAGACLASYLAMQERSFIIIVLNSKKLSERFVDTQNLRHWLMKKEKIGKKYQQSQRQSEQLSIQLNK